MSMKKIDYNLLDELKGRYSITLHFFVDEGHVQNPTNNELILLKNIACVKICLLPLRHSVQLLPENYEIHITRPDC